MRDLPIAYGNSCYAKTWANKTTAWEDLCERLKNTIRTTETVEEYPNLKKDDRDRAKDKGGFVGGYLKGNRRKRETMVCRSMLTMDADHAEIGFIDRFASECRYSSCLYTTHGHTSEQPRCRIIVPLTRDITPDEYVALARYFASDWGIDQFDECSYKPSHHATDPACGKLLNAFDLVRIHRFGDDDEKKSFKQMTELALSDDTVKENLAAERIAQAGEDFSDDADWHKRLHFVPRSGALENSVWNLNLILENDPDLQGFAFNDMANRIQVTGELPWDRPEGNSFWRDADTAQLKSLVDIRYGEFTTRNYDVSFTKVADDRHFHPVRDYLNGLPKWDGVKRVEELFIKYLQADDTEYVRTVTRKTFAAAVARVMCPGIKFDCVPVLDGEQGIGKSSIVKDLVTPEYYSESLSLTDMDDKAGAEKLQGFWVVEIGELAGMKKADIEKVKSFLSTSDDKYRPSYGRVVESHPRQCIIIGTVNGERGYLRDITGNRRFWIIKVHQKTQKQNWHFTQADRDQFWAEAKAIWESGEKLYLEGDILAESEKAQRNAMEVDERVGMVEEYLNTLLPEGWDSMDVYARRSYLSGDPTAVKGTVERTTVSNAEIWCECFGKNLSELKATDSYAIAALMTQIPGWKRGAAAKRLPLYGKQRIYEKG